MSGGPAIFPRPGVRPVILIDLIFEFPIEDLSEIEKAEIESDINERFSEPEDMERIEMVFRSTVSQLDNETITVATTTTHISKDILNELIEIVENSTGKDIFTWEINNDIRRKGIRGGDFV